MYLSFSLLVAFGFLLGPKLYDYFSQLGDEFHPDTFRGEINRHWDESDGEHIHFIEQLGGAKRFNIRLVSIVCIDDESRVPFDVSNDELRVTQEMLSELGDALGLSTKLQAHEHFEPGSYDKFTEKVSEISQFVLGTDLDTTREATFTIVLLPASTRADGSTLYPTVFRRISKGFVVIEGLDHSATEALQRAVLGFTREALGISGTFSSASALIVPITPDEASSVLARLSQSNMKVAEAALRSTWVLHRELQQLSLTAADRARYKSAHQCICDASSMRVAITAADAGDISIDTMRKLYDASKACVQEAMVFIRGDHHTPDGSLSPEHYLALYGPYWVPLIMPVIKATRMSLLST